MHDESIVDSNHNDLVDALGSELLLVLEVGRDVHGLAGGGESAGNGDEDDLLALSDGVEGDGLVLVGGLVVPVERPVGQRSSNGDRRHLFLRLSFFFGEDEMNG